MRLGVGVLVLLLVAACGAKTPRVAEPEAEPAPTGDRAGGLRARELAGEIQAALRRGDVDALHAVIDPAVLVVGPGANHVFSSRTDALVALRGALGAGRPHRVTPRGLQVVASASGRSAFVAGELSVDGPTYRVAAVLAEIDGIWSVTAVHISTRASSAATPPVALGEGSAAPEELMTRFESALAKPSRLAEQLADRRDVVYLATEGDPVRGAAAIRKKWKGIFGDGARLAMRGRPRSRLTPDGALGWIAADLDVTAAGGSASPQRALFIYDAAAGWRLVALHTSR